MDTCSHTTLDVGVANTSMTQNQEGLCWNGCMKVAGLWVERHCSHFSVNLDNIVKQCYGREEVLAMDGLQKVFLSYC